MSINRTEYPHYLNEMPLIFGVSFFCVYLAGFVFWGLALIEVNFFVNVALSVILTASYSFLDRSIQRDFVFFFLRKKSTIDWFDYFLKKKEKIGEKESERKNNSKKYYIFELEQDDLNQRTIHEIQEILSELRHYFHALSEKDGFYYKLYHLESLDPPKTYIVTNDINFNVNCRGLKVKAKLKSIENEIETSGIIFNGLDSKIPVVSQFPVGKDNILVNGQYWKLVNVYKMSDLDLCKIQMYGYDYFICFKKKKAEIVKRKSKAKRRMHYTNLTSSMRDHESEKSYGQNEKLIQDIIDGRQSVFDIEIWLIVKNRDFKVLSEDTENICRKLTHDGFIPFVETVAISSVIKSMRLDTKPLLRRTHIATTDDLINTLPLTIDVLYEVEPHLRFNSVSGKSLKFGLFSDMIESYSAVVTGGSGSGKSFSINFILKFELSIGSSAIVLDLGLSFKKTTMYYGGEQLSEKFNPFAFHDPVYLKEIIKSVIPEKEMTSLQEGQILIAIKEIVKNGMPTKSRDFISLLEEKTKILILPYFEEIVDFFSDDQITEFKKLLYVDISIYPERIRAPLILFLTEYFKRMSGQKIFVIDECWGVLKHHAEFFSGFVRTLRKNRGSAVAITQLLDDFAKTPFGNDILALSQHKIIYNQETKSDILDDFDREKIASAMTRKGEYSEFYYKSPTIRKILRYYPTALEYELFTSDKIENAKIEKFIDESLQYFSYRESMNRWVSFKYNIDIKDVL